MLSRESSLMLALRRRSPLTTMVTRLHKLVESVRDPYRPELHYMRGPGPKWHAKYRNHVGSAVLR
jgi:hypothetical protein